MKEVWTKWLQLETYLIRKVSKVLTFLYKIDASLVEGYVNSQLGVVWQVHISRSIQYTSLPEVESSLFMCQSHIVEIKNEVEWNKWFWYVYVLLKYVINWNILKFLNLLAYPFLFVFVFYLWWLCDTREHVTLQRSLWTILCI